MPKILMYILIVMCLTGQVLVTRNKRSGYLLWVIADAVWALFNFSQWKVIGATEQGILWTLYFIISLWGYLIYKKFPAVTKTICDKCKVRKECIETGYGCRRNLD